MGTSSEEIEKCVKHLESGQHIHRSLNRLLRLDASLSQFTSYGVKHLAIRYSKNSEYKTVSNDLLSKIQKLEDDSVFRKPYNTSHPSHQNRRRNASTSLSSSKSHSKLPKICTPEDDLPSLEPSSKSSSESCVVTQKNVIEVTKLKNLEESDYDRVRPTLVTLSAKQLKSFMDQNPRIELIGDGLFRRHCQMDCPEEVPKKLITETWRTLHDVFINWKLYQEAKVWEKKINEGLENYVKMKTDTQ
ncbi:Protein CBG03375 [Caenorhabditis briggsae]|uniref:Protein CBG03375 n=2 Tax=Caenorhabditis briggsae TaxID=6238 RepID=A8WUW5_CAEBR|nr:Protein CBG03375 [Caenorhabditis briggsae]ULT95861.1 hypothetical protein L3Y34_004492 [Caenorhabditis briggsae]CAP24276.1 Protein CBG03375 [Caenorhabditis briggsae]